MDKKPHPIDVQVGKNLQAIRKMRGLSQEKLGEALGVTFQQVQKYEKGTNRISSSKMFICAKHLNVSIMNFYAGTGALDADENSIMPHEVSAIVKLIEPLSDLSKLAVKQLAKSLQKVEAA